MATEIIKDEDCEVAAKQTLCPLLDRPCVASQCHMWTTAGREVWRQGRREPDIQVVGFCAIKAPGMHAHHL